MEMGKKNIFEDSCWMMRWWGIDIEELCIAMKVLRNISIKKLPTNHLYQEWARDSCVHSWTHQGRWTKEQQTRGVWSCRTLIRARKEVEEARRVPVIYLVPFILPSSRAIDSSLIITLSFLSSSNARYIFSAQQILLVQPLQSFGKLMAQLSKTKYRIALISLISM